MQGLRGRGKGWVPRVSPSLCGSRGDGLGHHVRELETRPYAELAVGARQVQLHGLLGDEERLGDLAVRHVLSGEVAYAPLGGRQGLHAAQLEARGAAAAGAEVAAYALRQRGRAAALRELQRESHVLAAL